MPGDVCGVEVQSALVEPLLPPGESFEQRNTHEGGGDITGCAMDVDKHRELTFQASLVPATVDPLQVKSSNLQRSGNPQKADIGGDARIADSAAMAYAACTYNPSDVDKRREDLTRFIEAYLPAAQKAAGCTS